MAEIPDEIIAEREQIETVLLHIKSILDLKIKTQTDLTALGAYVHNFYNGIENILKQLFKFKKIISPASPYWHKELIKTSLKEEVISQNLSNDLFEFLSFRHFFVHGYGHHIKEPQILAITSKIFSTWKDFNNQIELFLEK